MRTSYAAGKYPCHPVGDEAGRRFGSAPTRSADASMAISHATVTFTSAVCSDGCSQVLKSPGPRVSVFPDARARSKSSIILRGAAASTLPEFPAYS